MNLPFLASKMIFRQERLDLKTIREQDSGVAACSMIANGRRKQSFSDAQSQPVKVNVDRNVLYIKFCGRSIAKVAVVCKSWWWNILPTDGLLILKQIRPTSNEVWKVCQFVHREKIRRGALCRIYVTWNENVKIREMLFVAFLQVFLDKTATTLKSSARILYPAHVVLQNFFGSV